MFIWWSLFRALINSLVRWFCTSALGLVPLRSYKAKRISKILISKIEVNSSKICRFFFTFSFFESGTHPIYTFVWWICELGSGQRLAILRPVHKHMNCVKHLWFMDTSSCSTELYSRGPMLYRRGLWKHVHSVTQLRFMDTCPLWVMEMLTVLHSCGPCKHVNGVI